MDRRSPHPRRVLLLGATGTIGRATLAALAARGHEVVCFVRPGRQSDPALAPASAIRAGDVSDPLSLRRDAFVGEKFDAVVSCLASRTGAPKDAWAIDHRANSLLLAASMEADIRHFVLLSAICVQRPLLAFQHAKLAFEKELAASGIGWSIVRPTAFFKSLSGQVERVRRGRPFLVFGDGELTACKPIGARDLGEFIAGCLDDPRRMNRILPVGGPGEAITPRKQGEMLFRLLGRKPRFRHVPVAMLDAIIAVLAGLGRLFPSLAEKAEFARIGRYYATESMLVLDPATGLYDADNTLSFGVETLEDYYRGLIAGRIADERGEHAVF
jgi:divinyl chlorophyllide a 8-vinyl-reductase